jgi:hypothetical protein
MTRNIRRFVVSNTVRDVEMPVFSRITDYHISNNQESISREWWPGDIDALVTGGFCRDVPVFFNQGYEFHEKKEYIIINMQITRNNLFFISWHWHYFFSPHRKEIYLKKLDHLY